MTKKNVTLVSVKFVLKKCYSSQCQICAISILDQLNLIIVSIFVLADVKSAVEEESLNMEESKRKRINRKGICIEMSSFHGKERFSGSKWHWNIISQNKIACKGQAAFCTILEATKCLRCSFKNKKKCLSRNSLDRFVWQRSVASLVLFVLALKTVLASVLKRYWQINVWAIEQTSLAFENLSVRRHKAQLPRIHEGGGVRIY